MVGWGAPAGSGGAWPAGTRGGGGARGGCLGPLSPAQPLASLIAPGALLPASLGLVLSLRSLPWLISLLGKRVYQVPATNDRLVPPTILRVSEGSI